MRSVLCVAIMLAGCGGGTPAPRTADRPSEDPYARGVAPEPDAGAESAQPQTPPSGPAQVLVKVRIGAAEVASRVRILDEEDHVVSEGDAPLSAQIPSGVYTITAEISDASILVDRPTHRQADVEIRPGGPHEITIDVPVASVRLTVVRGGRAMSNPQITLMRPGSRDPVHRFRAGSEHIRISPGRYEADVVVGRQTIHVTGLMFPDGATQDIPITVND